MTINREEIRARCTALLAEYDKSKVAYLLVDTFALLDELDEKDAEYQIGVNAGADAIKRLRADRDRWKAHAEAWKRATRAFECSSVFSFACFCCVFKDTTNAHICGLLGDEVCEDLENWQFDETRFSKED